MSESTAPTPGSMPSAPAGPWPPGWVPWTPRPPIQLNRLTLFGGVLVFVGYVLFAVADLAFATAPANAPYGAFVATYMVYVLGDVIIAVGFLLAFYSLAVRRS